MIYGDANSVLRNRKNTRKIDHLSLCGRYYYIFIPIIEIKQYKIRRFNFIRTNIQFVHCCFRRDGFQIRAVADEADEIVVRFKTGNDVQRSGFSCLVYTHPKSKYNTIL